MAQKSKKTTHSKAKGKTTHEKLRTTTARRSGVVARRAPKPKKTPAQSQAPAENQPPDSAASGGSAEHGFARLKKGAQKIVGKDSEKLLDALESKALRGFASSLRYLVDLAKPGESNSAPNQDCGPFTPVIASMIAEPEYFGPDLDDDPDWRQDGDRENPGAGEPQSGARQTARPVPES